MRAVIQKVTQASVTVEDEKVGKINNGLLVFLGVAEDDDRNDLKYLFDKIVNLRIFEDENEKMNLSLLDVEGELLVVSQFTLLADCRKGRRPSFEQAAKPEYANLLYEEFVKMAKEKGIFVNTGKFRSHMYVNLTNDGPITILLDSKKNF